LSLWGDQIRQAMMDAALDRHTNTVVAYEAGPGRREHRYAGAHWFGEVTGSPPDPDRIVVCNGAQHALLCALLVTCRSGDRVATERLTYAGLKAVAPVLGLTLVPIDIDHEGLLPAALDQACRKGPIKALVTVPDLHNPTTATQSLKRRKEVAKVAQRHRLTIIEDAVYAGLVEDKIASITSIAAGPSIRLLGLSKTLGPGLRIGYLDAPTSLIGQLAGVLRATSWMASPIQAEIATRLIQSGAASNILAANREELASRNSLVRNVLVDFKPQTAPGSPHAWLRLPAPWTRESFQAWGQRSGLLTLTADSFSVDRECPDHAVRLSVSAPPSRDSLEAGLRTIASALHGADILAETLA
jgi:DNA-binding transcriptional MocR family regulator